MNKYGTIPSSIKLNNKLKKLNEVTPRKKNEQEEIPELQRIFGHLRKVQANLTNNSTSPDIESLPSSSSDSSQDSRRHLKSSPVANNKITNGLNNFQSHTINRSSTGAHQRSALPKLPLKNIKQNPTESSQSTCDLANDKPDTDSSQLMTKSSINPSVIRDSNESSNQGQHKFERMTATRASMSSSQSISNEKNNYVSGQLRASFNSHKSLNPKINSNGIIFFPFLSYNGYGRFKVIYEGQFSLTC